MKTYLNIHSLPVYQIKKGPFAVYTGETIAIQQPTCTAGLFLTETDRVVLEIFNQYLVLSSHLLLRELKNRGLEDLEQKQLQHRLRTLSNAAYLQAARFVNSDGSYSANKVYFLGFRGRGYLKSLGIQPRLGGYIAQLDAAALKRYLSVNQYLINTGKKEHVVEVGRTIFAPLPNMQKPNKIFRAHGLVQEVDMTTIVEAVRCDGKWQEYILERLERMDATLKDKACAKDFARKIRLILIAEDSAHLRKLSALLQQKQYRSFEILLTTDDLVHEQPDRCLVEREKHFGFFQTLLAAACC